MKPDSEKSKDELIKELQEFRRQAAEADTLRRRLETLEKQCNDLKLNAMTKAFQSPESSRSRIKQLKPCVWPR